MENLRLRCLDFLKGLAMVAVITAHVSLWAGDPEKMYVHGFFWMVFQFAGPAGYSIITSMGVSLSILSNREKLLNKAKKNPDWVIFRRIIIRAIMLYGVGLFFVINFPAFDTMFGSIDGFIQSLIIIFDPGKIFRIHIFQLIAISQVFTFFALKLKPRIRYLIAIIIAMIDIFVYPYVVSQMVNDTGINDILFTDFSSVALQSYWGWIYALFFNNELGMAFFPWVIIPFLVPTAAEFIYSNIISKVKIDNTSLAESLDKGETDNENIKDIKIMKNSQNNLAQRTRQSLEELLKPVFKYAIILYFIGVISGLKLVSEFRNRPDLRWLNANEGALIPYHLNSYPLFLFNGSFQSLIYCTGIVIFFVGLGLKYNDFRRNPAFSSYSISKKKDLRITGRFWLTIANKLDGFINLLENMGKYSMTAFVIHYVLRDFLMPLSLGPEIVIPAGFAVSFTVAYILRFWAEKYGGLYTMEFLFNPKIIDKEKIRKMSLNKQNRAR